jgi:cytochrome c biogenesis protein CcmG, thiol:disulfide interchange protein DsbE
VVQGFGGTVRFVVENYGDSELARRFGVTRYPALFVDDVLVATPKDFGFYGKGEGAGDGRYTPWKSATSHERFRADLTRMIELVLAGRAAEARAAVPAAPAEVPALPAFTLAGLDGRPIGRDALAGRVVLVEFWATWCPPCRGTLDWLGAVKRRHGDRVEVLAVAVESDEADVRRLAQQVAAPLHWAMGTPEVARAFGDVSAVPTLFVFDGQGRRVASYYGAPPTLHAEAEAEVEKLLRAAPSAR